MVTDSSESNDTSNTERSAIQQAWARVDNWLPTRPKWQQEALARICRRDDVHGAEAVAELAALLAEEVQGTRTIDVELPGTLTASEQHPSADAAAASVVLERISGVVGVNALAPKEALTLGPHLSVIYGENGSGKSGYVRILKQFGAARAVVSIRGNVFGDLSVKPAAQIGYRVGSCSKSYHWAGTGDGPTELKSIQIFDSDCAQVYLSKKNELVYKPRPLAVLGELSLVCDTLKKDATEQYEITGLWRNGVPDAHKVASEVAKLVAEKHLPDEKQLLATFTWCDADQSRLNELEQLLATSSPEEESKKIGRQIDRLEQLHNALKLAEERLTQSAWIDLAEFRQIAEEATQAAHRDARMAFDGRPLTEIAVSSWKLLWNAAREFSEQCAYPGLRFPWTDGGAKCVLCQQPLTEEVVERLQSFEAFVVGKLATDARTAADNLATRETQLRALLDPNAILGHVDGAALESDVRELVLGNVSSLRSIRDALLEGKPASVSVPVSVRPVLTTRLDGLRKRQSDCLVAAKADNREPQRLEVASLRAKQWMTSKRGEWQVWREQDRQLTLIDKLTKTTAISNLADDVAKLLLTDAFLQRFTNELKLLGAHKVRVVLKLDPGKAKTSHQVTLKAAQSSAKPNDVLSEGELRIVALAAFLTEAQFQHLAPIVLDDPVSSLDHLFEERVAERLVEIARERQVILFTHRISLMVLADECAKFNGVPIETVSVVRETWGAGEPECNPLYAQPTRAALNSLCNDRLANVRKAQAVSRDEYDRHAGLLAAEVRNTLERIVEHDLLAGVVLRFRRSINTMGKVEQLSRIEADDCRIIDRMMTKYSKFKHAQPDETPVLLPEPEEFAEDLLSLQRWHTEFQKKMKRK